MGFNSGFKGLNRLSPHTLQMHKFLYFCSPTVHFNIFLTPYCLKMWSFGALWGCLLSITNLKTLFNSWRKSSKMQQCIKIWLFLIYMKFNMFRTTHRPSSGAQNCIGSLWFFYTWNAAGRVVGGHCQAQCAWQRPPTTRPTTFHA